MKFLKNMVNLGGISKLKLVEFLSELCKPDLKIEACLCKDEQSKKMPAKNQSMLTHQFQNKRNQNISEEWVDQLTIGKNSVR